MSNSNFTLSQSRLLELFHYEPETGVFTRRIRSARMPAGSPADSFDRSTGYIRFGVDGKLQYAHRLAWLYVYGDLPVKPTIDHINRIRTDNRIINLREATFLEQSTNTSKRSSGRTSRHLGVHWCKLMKSYQAVISRNGVKYLLGYFGNEDCAGLAYQDAKARLDSQYSHGHILE